MDAMNAQQDFGRELVAAKWGSVTMPVPPAVAAGARGEERLPDVGDVALAEITRIGAHHRMEGRSGERITLYRGDRVVGVFGHRYAPEQFEGYAETEGENAHLLSVAGVMGVVRSRHPEIGSPTGLRLLGYLVDHDGRILNMRQFGVRRLPPAHAASRPTVIAVVGTMMNAGKTTAAAAIVRGAARRGLTVGAAKVTGTASGKDVAQMRDAGARLALDFTVCGWPSTYLCSAAELEDLLQTLLHSLAQVGPEVIVLELADGITQRETAMLLRSPLFASQVDGVIFAAGDALGAEAGVTRLQALRLPVVATSGRVSASPLLVAETVSLTRLPCLTREALAEGALFDVIARPAGVS